MALVIDGGKKTAKIFLHVRKNDVFAEDLEGVDLGTPDLALEEATAAAREIIAARMRMGDRVGADTFEIMTEDGSLLARVPFRSAARLD